MGKQNRVTTVTRERGPEKPQPLSMSMKVEDAPKEQLSTKLLPQALYVMWMLTFLTVGIYATTQDDSLKSHSCGKQTHLWKYSLWSTSFCGFCLSTFFVFPGGGEAARARAVLLSIVHTGFGMCAC